MKVNSGATLTLASGGLIFQSNNFWLQSSADAGYLTSGISDLYLQVGGGIRPVVGDFNPGGTIETGGLHGRLRSGSRLNGIWVQSARSPMSCSGLRMGRSSR